MCIVVTVSGKQDVSGDYITYTHTDNVECRKGGCLCKRLAKGWNTLHDF